MQLIECLASNNTSELIHFESDLTITKAIEGTRLNKLATVIEKKNVIKAITYLTARLADNFNVGKKFTIEQSSLMALDLFDVFGYETLEDVVLMFKYARQGRIGDGKDFKLDSQTVFHKWVPEYLELKAVERENQHNKQKGENNSLPKWSMEDVEKFKVSDKKETLTTKSTGLGERSKKNFDTPEYKSPIVNRASYLKGLEYEATKAPIHNLNNALEHFKSKNEQDAIDVIEKEINSRESKNT
jgi:hypothetical protein